MFYLISLNYWTHLHTYIFTIVLNVCQYFNYLCKMLCLSFQGVQSVSYKIVQKFLDYLFVKVLFFPHLTHLYYCGYYSILSTVMLQSQPLSHLKDVYKRQYWYTTVYLFIIKIPLYHIGVGLHQLHSIYTFFPSIC